MNLSEANRAYIYRALLAVQPLAVAYGLVTDNLAALWVNVGAAVLGIGLATANTSTKAPAPSAAGMTRMQWLALESAEAEADAQAAIPVLTAEQRAAIDACPTPYYHDTHRYCPSCPWTEDVTAGRHEA